MASDLKCYQNNKAILSSLRNIYMNDIICVSLILIVSIVFIIIYITKEEMGLQIDFNDL